MTNVIEGLMEMVEQGQSVIENFPFLHETEIPVPDAKVLLVIEDQCDTCGSTTQHPNRSLLIRFGVSYHRPESWCQSYQNLPSEELVRVEEVQSCKECFHGGH